MELGKLIFALKATCSGGQAPHGHLLLSDLQRCAHHLVASGQAATAEEAVQRISEHVTQAASPPGAPASIKLAAANMGPLLPVVAQQVQGLRAAEQGLGESLTAVSVPGWSMDSQNLWTLVMDQKVKTGPFELNSHPFSYSESDYVASLLKSMAQVVKDVHQPIDANGLKALHRAALQHRRGADDVLGQFRDGVAVEFAPACGDWASEEHIQALKQVSDHDSDNRFYAFEEIDGRGTVVHAKALPRAELESHVDDVLSRHHRAMSSCESAEKKVELIAATCHELALTHPFSDGNGRVIGGLLVNRLLLEAGLPPYRPLSVGLVDLPPADFAEHICNACGIANTTPKPEPQPRRHFSEFMSDAKPLRARSPATFPAPG
jgi:hypothetical protein